MSFKLDKESYPQIAKLMKAVVNDSKEISWPAQLAVARVIEPIVSNVLPQVQTSDMLFETFAFDPSDPPRVSIDAFEYLTPGSIRVWSETVDGGLHSNEFIGNEFRYFDMSTLTSAVHGPKRAFDAAVNAAEKLINRMVEEIRLAEDQMGWSVFLGTLAEARNGFSANGTSNSQVIPSASKAAGAPTRNFTIDDLNSLITRLDSLRPAWAGGTPGLTIGGGITDIFGSIEFFNALRKMSYNPQNTVGATVGVVPMTDQDRQALWNATDTFVWGGITYHKLRELGKGSYLNNLFAQKYQPTGTDPTFNPVTEDLVIAADLSVDGVFFKAANGNNVMVRPDDQYVERSGMVGWYAKREVGFLSNDKKTLAGLIW